MSQNTQPKLTPSQALSIVDQATSTFAGTRADHQKIAEAIGVLVEVVRASEANAKTDIPAAEKV